MGRRKQPGSAGGRGAVDTSSASEFAAAVFAAVAAIPVGTVASYGEIAKLAGFPGYARHVGRLMSQLPSDSSLPWHRVIRADGKLPLGEWQANRLAAEGISLDAGRISLRHRRKASHL